MLAFRFTKFYAKATKTGVIAYIGKDFFSADKLREINEDFNCHLERDGDDLLRVKDPRENLIGAFCSRFNYDWSFEQLDLPFNGTSVPFVYGKQVARVFRLEDGTVTKVTIQVDSRTQVSFSTFVKGGFCENGEEEVTLAVPKVELSQEDNLLEQERYSWLKGANLVLSDDGEISNFSRFDSRASLSIGENGIVAKVVTTFATMPKGIHFPSPLPEGTIVFDKPFTVTISVDGEDQIQATIFDPTAK